MLLRIPLVVLAVLAVMVLVGWLGFRVKPTAVEAVLPGEAFPALPMPTTLSGPIARYARALYGDTLPKVETAIVAGRATMTVNGLTMPSRFFFYYDADPISHYHDIQVTWFNLLIMRIHERFREGHARLDMAIIGQVENSPKVDHASLQGFYAETLAWLPAIALSDAAIRWETLDDHTARAFLPGADDAEAFTLRFDPVTGLLTEVEALRYREANSAARSRWICRALAWGDLNGTPTMLQSEIQWDEDAPWVQWELEQVAVNVPVEARLNQFGGDV